MAEMELSRVINSNSSKLRLCRLLERFSGSRISISSSNSSKGIMCKGSSCRVNKTSQLERIGKLIATNCPIFHLDNRGSRAWVKENDNDNKYYFSSKCLHKNELVQLEQQLLNSSVLSC